MKKYPYDLVMPSLPQVSLPQINFPELSGGKRMFLIAGLVLVGLLVVIGVILTMVFKRAGPVEITMVGLWEPESVYQEVIDDYRRLHPNVTVKYAKQSPINYRDRVMAAMARDDGPDIVTIHNTWLPMFKGLLTPASPEAMSVSGFAGAFYPVMVKDFVAGGAVWAVPLGFDSLGLYVNQDLFNSAGVGLPTTWEEFRSAASRLTVRDSGGRINTAGAAMGVAANVDHWQDIVSLMMLQAGVNLSAEANSLSAVEALTYYTTLATVDRVWDETLDGSTLAFASGKVAMYFGPSWRHFDIKSISPELNFKVISVPQLSGGKTVNFATYWGMGVSKKSANSQVAWDFLKFLTSEEELTKIYSAAAKLRGFGEPYPRTAMATLLAADPVVSPFILAAPTAQSWYLASFTSDGDTGINSRIGKYFLDAVNGVVRGNDAKTVLDTVASGVGQVLTVYTVK